jgi:uncharacterized protein YijF (DUF1287 family)
MKAHNNGLKTVGARGVKKPSKAKKGSANQARSPRSPSHGVGAEAAPARESHPSPAYAPTPGQLPSAAFPREDRLSLALLLAPVLVVTLALGAMQLLVPADSARRQLALLPAPLALPAAAPALALSAEPGSIDHTVGPVVDRPPPASTIGIPTLQTTAVYEPAKPISSIAELRELPPGQSVLARLAALGHPDRCEVTPLAAKAPFAATPASVSQESFGRMLAAAARRETEDLVVYTDKYRDMGFPMGDVRPLYGVCTDVVVRAYRALGIDLQVLVHNAKLGTGDPAIDHRRVETLRRFFAKYGTSLPVTDFAEEYLPGDIVSYRRPEGRGSQTHIAIVSDVIAPSGRPMVVHNRGWGPQLEDALFANGMTGHYRFSKVVPELSASTPRPAQHAEQTAQPDAETLKVNTAAR